MLDSVRQQLALERRKNTSAFKLLLLDHFRKVCDSGSFYSLPVALFDRIPGTEIATALQGSYSVPRNSAVDSSMAVAWLFRQHTWGSWILNGNLFVLNHICESESVFLLLVVSLFSHCFCFVLFCFRCLVWLTWMSRLQALVPKAIPRESATEKKTRTSVSTTTTVTGAGAWTDASEDDMFLASADANQRSVFPNATALQKSNVMNTGSDPDSDLIIFRIPHRHPHMLKRPLQHADDISGFDFALRPYYVASTDGQVVKVQRQESPDIMVMELISATTVTAEKLIRGLKQWSVQPDVILETGLRPPVLWGSGIGHGMTVSSDFISLHCTYSRIICHQVTK